LGIGASVFGIPTGSGNQSWDFDRDWDVGDGANLAQVTLPDSTTVIAWGNQGPNTTLYRLREGIERFMITDINNPAASAMAQSEICVMFDFLGQSGSSGAGGGGVAKFNHVPGGSNVLYMDGHVEFIRYPGEYPLTPVVAYVMGEGNWGSG
jgi:prepilin-type processing-associated H-X9-DG protein